MRFTLRSLFGLALVVLLAEALLRMAQHEQPVHDPLYGTIYPNQTVIRRLGEGHAISHWDANAVRIGPSTSAQAAPILAVGDSFTEALQVDDDAAFTAVTQRDLAKANVSVKMLDVGRGSQSPADYVWLAPHYRSRFRPVWTVVQLDQADLEGDALDVGKTHFVPQGDTLRVIPYLPHYGRFTKALQWLRDRSVLLDRLVAKTSAYREGARMPPLFRAAEVERLEPNALETWQRQMPVEATLDAVRAAYEDRLTFLYLPYFETETPLTEQRFTTWCASHDVSCVDLRETFPAFRAAGSAPTGFSNSRFGIGHMNVAGHRAAGRLLADELLKVRQRGLF